MVAASHTRAISPCGQPPTDLLSSPGIYVWHHRQRHPVVRTAKQFHTPGAGSRSEPRVRPRPTRRQSQRDCTVDVAPRVTKNKPAGPTVNSQGREPLASQAPPPSSSSEGATEARQSVGSSRPRLNSTRGIIGIDHVLPNSFSVAPPGLCGLLVRLPGARAPGY